MDRAKLLPFSLGGIAPMMKRIQYLVACVAVLTGFAGYGSVAEEKRAIHMTGNLTQGGMVWGRAAAGSKMMIDGKPIKVGPNGEFVFGFGRDAGPTVTLTHIAADGKKAERTMPVAQREFDIERIDGLPPKKVTPPPEWAERRKVERSRVQKARSFSMDTTHWLEGFMQPAVGRFSGFYGSQRILNGKPRSPHYGIDIAAPVGEPVYAPASGTVRLAAPDFLLEGGIIIIDHGYSVTSTLFHLDSLDVEEGDVVGKGDKIGTVGATGRATGPHVDWRVNWGNVRLDPYLLLSDKHKK